MSMPKLPEVDPNMTCDRALNMILASIAMEEVALSHILNAEGEKIQYVLGTLKKNCDGKNDVDDVLRVNQSVSNLLDSVSQNQMILKSKMERAIQAMSEKCKERPEPPPGCKCPPKCSASFKLAKRRQISCGESTFHWEKTHSCGKCVCYDPCDNSKIGLRTKGRFLVSILANVRAVDCRCNASVSAQMINGRHCTNIYTAYCQAVCNDTVTMSLSNIIVENHECSSYLLFKLKSSDELIVEDSVLNIVEI